MKVTQPQQKLTFELELFHLDIELKWFGNLESELQRKNEGPASLEVLPKTEFHSFIHSSYCNITA